LEAAGARARAAAHRVVYSSSDGGSCCRRVEPAVMCVRGARVVVGRARQPSFVERVRIWIRENQTRGEARLLTRAVAADLAVVVVGQGVVWRWRDRRRVGISVGANGVRSGILYIILYGEGYVYRARRIRPGLLWKLCCFRLPPPPESMIPARIRAQL